MLVGLRWLIRPTGLYLPHRRSNRQITAFSFSTTFQWMFWPKRDENFWINRWRALPTQSWPPGTKSALLQELSLFWGAFDFLLLSWFVHNVDSTCFEPRAKDTILSELWRRLNGKSEFSWAFLAPSSDRAWKGGWGILSPCIEWQKYLVTR